MPVAQRSGSQEGGEQNAKVPPKSSQAEVSAMFFFNSGFIQSIPKPTFLTVPVQCGSVVTFQSSRVHFTVSLATFSLAMTLFLSH